jgi:hypothetical protein
MTLTEQWKKGELENDWYYIRTTNGIEKWEYIKQSHGFGYYETEWVLEVLAPVPSYDDFKRIIDDWRDVSYENKNLKKLLLSSRGFVDKERITLETSGFGHNEYCRRTKELLTAIDNAIGEK